MNHRQKANFFRSAAISAVLLMIATGHAQAIDPVKPTMKDKCPVCGMFVYKYPDWLAEIIFKDGTVVFFDGAKDMLKYYFNFKKYSPGKRIRDISAIYVNEYYDMKLIDARKAFFVTGSDVYGPMGHELIPLNTKEDARAFMIDHRGNRVLRFEEITSELIMKLD